MPSDLSHRTNRKLSPGWHYPLGATPGLGGVNFSLYSATAEEVWLLLFDRPDGDPTDVIRSGTGTGSPGTSSCTASAPASSTGTRSGVPSTRPGASASTTRSCCSTRTRRRSPASSSTRTTCCSPTTRATRRGDLSLDRRDNPAVVPKAIVVDDRVRLAGGRAAVHPVRADGDLRDPPQRVHRPPLVEGGAPGDVPGLHREDPAPSVPRRERRRAPARPRVLRRRLPSRGKG